MFPACAASLTFKPAHLHTREFSGYRIPSLLPPSPLRLIISLPSSASPQACLLLQSFLPCGEAAPRLTGSDTDSSHSASLFFMLSPSFSHKHQSTHLAANMHVLLNPPLACITSLKERHFLPFLPHDDKHMEPYHYIRVNVCICK